MEMGMGLMLQVFLTVNILVWAVQTVLDIKLKHIHPFVAVPALASPVLIWESVSLISFGLLLLVPIQYIAVEMGVGDTTLLLLYIASTTPRPITGILNLFIVTGIYILITQEILDLENVPMAPAGLTALTLTYLPIIF